MEAPMEITSRYLLSHSFSHVTIHEALIYVPSSIGSPWLMLQSVSNEMPLYKC